MRRWRLLILPAVLVVGLSVITPAHASNFQHRGRLGALPAGSQRRWQLQMRLLHQRLQLTCDHWHIVFEPAADYQFNQEWYRIGVACHEIGHTVGLEHGPTPSVHECMTSTPSSKFIGTHNAAHINGKYDPDVGVQEPAGTGPGGEPSGTGEP
jgi:hypothetical protein